MRTASEILEFDSTSLNLISGKKKLISPSLLRHQEIHLNKLDKMAQELGDKQLEPPNKYLIPQVFRKFKLLIKNGPSLFNNFENREIRTLAYSLDYSEAGKTQIYSSPKELDVVFETLLSNWRDSYLIGLIDCYLKNWESNQIVSSQKLEKFIFQKLRLYKDNRKVLKSFKSNRKFFDGKNGNLLFGNELALKELPVKEAPKYISLPDSWFSHLYFSKVILTYYEKRKNEIKVVIEDLNNALLAHNNSITNKRVVSRLIIQANRPEFSSLQDRVKNIAFNLIGDPGNLSNWAAFDNATEGEKTELNHARSILNEWITKLFIKVFFEKCINNSRRKSFWLKYTKEIKQFRVVGSYYIRKLLLNDNRISDFVDPRFSRINSLTDTNSALMFIMNNHLFVEFSDSGAFYAYKLSNQNAPSIDAQYFPSTSNLKISNMNMLIYRNGKYVQSMNEEGRLSHSDGELNWEPFADYWIKNKAGINV